MWALLLGLTLACDVPREGGASVRAVSVDQAPPLDAPPASTAHPLSLALFEARPALGPPSWKDPLDEPLPERSAVRDTLDLEWLIAPRAEGFTLGPRTSTPIDPYRFDAPAPLVEVRASSWTDPWRERELQESLWELREKNGVNLRLSVSRSECWWR
jgi:hypothetical protein